ncbi:MAG TPA: 4Fe-4S binding protein, partial [Thermoleophilia bacterium]|nr:4Fe-4S binding protein [Thermoleophilia bacterium]
MTGSSVALRIDASRTGVSPLAESIDCIAREAGVDVVGFGDVREALPVDFQHLPVGVSLGVAHPAMTLLRERSSAVSEKALQRALSDHRDAQGQAVLETALRRIADHLRSRGYRYFCCPPEVDPMETPFAALMAGRFSHKAAATCAGLGNVGRHGLLNHRDFGPHMVWATVVTNAPIPTGSPVRESECGSCRLCVAACPGGAISGRPWRRDDGMQRLVDVAKCREVLDENERATGRRVCGRCAV